MPRWRGSLLSCSRDDTHGLWARALGALSESSFSSHLYRNLYECLQDYRYCSNMCVFVPCKQDKPWTSMVVQIHDLIIGKAK